MKLTFEEKQFAARIDDAFLAGDADKVGLHVMLAVGTVRERVLGYGVRIFHAMLADAKELLDAI